MGRYLLAAMIGGLIPVVVLVNGCDSRNNPVVQPDGSVPTDGGSAGKGGGAGGQAGGGASSGGAGGQAGGGVGSGGAGGQAGGGASSGGVGGQAGLGSHAGGAGGVGAAGGQGGRDGATGFGPGVACLNGTPVSVEPVAGACCSFGGGRSMIAGTKCTSDHMSLGTCFSSTNYQYVWQVQPCRCADGEGGAGGGYCY